MQALLKKPLEQIGKQIKILGSFWEGTMTAEEKALEYFCTVRDFSAMHKFVGGDCSQAFQMQEMGTAGSGSLEHAVA